VLKHVTHRAPLAPQAVALTPVSQLRSARQHPKRQFVSSHFVNTHRWLRQA
jgi:hypothetical protein